MEEHLTTAHASLMIISISVGGPSKSPQMRNYSPLWRESRLNPMELTPLTEAKQARLQCHNCEKSRVDMRTPLCRSFQKFGGVCRLRSALPLRQVKFPFRHQYPLCIRVGLRCFITRAIKSLFHLANSSIILPNPEWSFLEVPGVYVQVCLRQTLVS